MKRLSYLVVSVLFSLFIVPTVSAQSDQYPVKTVTLSSDQVFDGDYFAAGDVVEIYGTVNGDLYAAGGQVVIDGTVNGDLLVAGGTVIVSGTVTQDVRAAGGTINISGTIGRNTTVGAGDITFNKTAVLGGSIVGGAGNVLIAAPVDGNIKVAAGNLTISNEVTGKIEAGVEQLRLTSEANVVDVVYWSENDASIDTTATISGTITKKVAVIPQRHQQESNRMDTGYLLYWILATLMFGLVLSYLFPRQITSINKHLKNNPWKALAWGTGALVVIPITAFLLMFTIIGIPLSLFVLVLYILALYLSKFFVMVFVGNWILTKYTKTSSLIKSLVIGLLLFSVMKLIPLTSFLVGLASLLFGLGSLVLSLRVNLKSNKVN